MRAELDDLQMRHKSCNSHFEKPLTELSRGKGVLLPVERGPHQHANPCPHGAGGGCLFKVHQCMVTSEDCYCGSDGAGIKLPRRRLRVGA